MRSHGIHLIADDGSPEDWCVPTVNAKPIIKHGHTNPHDHSACGPVIFCCLRSARVFMEAYPASAEATADWHLVTPADAVQWIQKGLQRVYFVFCDPEVSTRIRSIGLGGTAMLTEVLERRVDLEEFAESATPIEPPDNSSFLLDRVKAGGG